MKQALFAHNPTMKTSAHHTPHRQAEIGRGRIRMAVLALAIVGGLLGATACAGESTNVDAQNLIGDWVVVEGASVGARTGTPQGSDHATEAGDYLLPNAPAIEWTLRITDAAPGGLIGQWCSPRLCEPVAGAVRRDGTAIMADEDSIFTLARYGNEIELCVASPGDIFQVAACHLLRRA